MLSQQGKQFDYQFKYMFKLIGSLLPLHYTCRHVFESDWSPVFLSPGEKHVGS